jgi:23S rRNA (uracil1939-C5)-methyltransferase
METSKNFSFEKSPLPRFSIYGYDDKLVVEGKGEQKLFVESLGLTMDAGVFFQSNLELQKKMLRDIKEIAGSGKTALDIYSGAGVFAFSLSDSFEKITLVEENTKALSLSRENLRNTLCEKDFIAFSAEVYSKALLDKGGDLPSFDLVIADPPREGLSPSFVRLLLKLKTKSFIYVSCNPATLARDAKLLCTQTENSFNLEAITFYDFYPQTPHIESVTLFKRKVKENNPQMNTD